MTAKQHRRGTRPIHTLAVSVGVIAAAAAGTAPAHADSTSDAFLSALNNAGIGYGDPANAVALGQQICPMLAQPGGNVANVASTMVGQNGLSAAMAGLFTSIAISTYCPSMMSSIANGDWLANGTVPGLPLPISGLPDIAGLSGLIPQ